MLFTDLFSHPDICQVCGQTPCNCTHIAEGADAKVDESLADQIMASARAAGLNPRLAGTPEQERERSQQILAQRAQEREEAARQAALADARILDSLKDEYKQMNDRYKSLGGSNWQYADREQNLSNNEREARSMEPALRNLGARITRAEAVITKEEPKQDEKIGGMDADKFDAAMARLKQLAGAGPLKTVWDPTKRVYRNVPTAQQPKK